MAHSRLISRDLSTSDRFWNGGVSDLARILYCLSLAFSDREGRLPGSAGKLRTLILPRRMLSDEHTASLRDELVGAGLWTHYTDAKGREVVQIVRFFDYQPGYRPGSKRYVEEAASKYGPPPANPHGTTVVPRGNHGGTTTVPPGKESKEKESKEKTAPGGAGPLAESENNIASSSEDTEDGSGGLCVSRPAGRSGFDAHPLPQVSTADSQPPSSFASTASRKPVTGSKAAGGSEGTALGVESHHGVENASSGQGPLAGDAAQVLRAARRGSGEAPLATPDPIASARTRAEREVLPEVPSASVYDDTMNLACRFLGVERDGGQEEIRVMKYLERWAWNRVSLNSLRRVLDTRIEMKPKDPWAYLAGAMKRAIPETHERYAVEVDRALDAWKAADGLKVRGAKP